MYYRQKIHYTLGMLLRSLYVLSKDTDNLIKDLVNNLHKSISCYNFCSRDQNVTGFKNLLIGNLKSLVMVLKQYYPHKKLLGTISQRYIDAIIPCVNAINNDRDICKIIALAIEDFYNYMTHVNSLHKTAPSRFFNFQVVVATRFQGDPFNKILSLENNQANKKGTLFLGRAPVSDASFLGNRVAAGAFVDDILTKCKPKLIVSFLEPWVFKNTGINFVNRREWEVYRIQQHYFNVIDRTDTFKITDFLQTLICTHRLLVQGDNVYVHCKSGIGRSATFVAAYMIVLKLIKNPDDQQNIVGKTIKEMQSRRKIVQLHTCQKQFLYGNMCLWEFVADAIKKQDFHLFECGCHDINKRTQFLLA